MYDFDNDDITDVDVQEQDIDDILQSLGLEIAKSTIVGQIDGTLPSKKDFLNIILSKYQTIKENVVDLDDMKLIEGEIIEFSLYLIDKIKDHYNLYINLDEDDSMESLKVLMVLYSFFIINHEMYVKTFILNYIRINKSRIVNAMDIGGKGTDITSNAYRKQGLAPNDIAILANVNAVIDFVSDQEETTPIGFLDIINDGDYYVVSMKDLFESQVVGGDYVEIYLDEIVDERCSESALHIRNEIRMELLGRI